MPEFVLKNLYLAFIEPHVTYCLPIWGGTFPSYLQTLFILQKRAIRIITKSSFLEHTRPLFCSRKILNIYDMLKMKVAEHVYRNINSYEFQRHVHHHYTRRREDLVIPIHSLNTFQRSLSYCGPKIWNIIPEEIRNKRSLKVFQRLLKSNLLSKYELH